MGIRIKYIIKNDNKIVGYELIDSNNGDTKKVPVEQVERNIEIIENAYHFKNKLEITGAIEIDIKRSILEVKNSLLQWSLMNGRYDIIESWNSKYNNNKQIYSVSYGVETKYTWECKSCGGTWEESVIRRRKRGAYCHNCGNDSKDNERELRDGIEEIMLDWDYSKNSIEPTRVIYKGSNANIKIYWKCHICGHRWDSMLSSRLYKCICPKCETINTENKRSFVVVKGVNDLESYCIENKRYDILMEWNEQINGKASNNFAKASAVKEWKCSKCNHEYKISTYRRISIPFGYGCINCADKSRSIPEHLLYQACKEKFPMAINNDRLIIKPLEIDIFIPELNVAIEYDGRRWHKDEDREIEKDTRLINKGIRILRVREEACRITREYKVIVVNDLDSAIDEAIEYLISLKEKSEIILN